MPAARIARGATRIGREPLFLKVSAPGFAAPRTLDVDLATPDPKQADAGNSVQPPAARNAYGQATMESEALYTRIIAGARQLAQEADDQLLEVTDKTESELQRALARLDEDFGQRRLDAAARRDFALNRIASRTDLLRFYVAEQANIAFGRLGAMRQRFSEAIAAQRPRAEAAIASLAGVRNAAYDASNSAHAAIQQLQLNPAEGLARAPDFQEAGRERGPNLVAAMRDAAQHYCQPSLAGDDEALATRLEIVGKFVDPLIACSRCEVDSKLRTIESHAENLGVAGPRAVRSARDSTLKAIDDSEARLNLTVHEAFRTTEDALAARHGQARAVLIAQAVQTTAQSREDIEATAEQQIEALTGVARAQPAALAMVHAETREATHSKPASAATMAKRAADRLRRNIRNVSDRHPQQILHSAADRHSHRRDRIDATGRDLNRLVRQFAEQQKALIRDSFDQVAQSVDQTLFGMAGMPGQVGKTCDGMLRAARTALEAARATLPADIDAIIEKVEAAKDGLKPPSRTPTPGTPGTAGNPGSDPLMSTPVEQPNMSVADPTPVSSPATHSGSATSAAGSTNSTPATPANTSGGGGATGAATDQAGGGGSGNAPASCGTCQSARAAAAGPAPAPGTTSSSSDSGSPASGSATGGNSAPGGGSNTPASTNTGDDVGVSSERTNMRSPRAYAEFCRPIARNALTAPRTASFIASVAERVPEILGQRATNAHTALMATGETDNDKLMGALRGLTQLEGRALTEVYYNMFRRDLASEIRKHAFDSWVTAPSTDRFNRDAALDALEGRAAAAALNELQAAFNYSNETNRIFQIMQSLTRDQMAELVANHRGELESLMTQLSTSDQARFRSFMDDNGLRARSTMLRTEIDGINRRNGWSNRRDARTYALGDAFATAETGPGWNIEGAADRVDTFGLEDTSIKSQRASERWEAVQRDFAHLDGVAEAIATANPDAAVSRPDDPPGAAMLAYATRPLEAYRLYEPHRRSGETREQALARQSEYYAGLGLEVSEERNDRYGSYRSATTSLNPYQQHYLAMVVRHGAQSREARAARALSQFRRSDGRPPDYRDVEKSLHSGIADAREGGNFEHGSTDEADADRLQTFAMMERHRRMLEQSGGSSAPISGEAARDSFRAEMARAYRDRPADLDVALGVIDSDAGNMQAVIDQAIAREDPALLTRYLGRMDSRQIAEVVENWNARHPRGPGLMQRLGMFGHHWSIGNMNGAAFTGDEANALEIAMMGVPQTPLQKAEVQHRIVEQQIEQAGWMGKIFANDEYQAMLDNARQLREVMGVTRADFDEYGRVRVVDPDTGERLRFNFDENGNFVPANRGDDTLFRRLMATTRLVADNYTQAVDRMASYITTGIAILAAVILSVVTMGTGTAVAIALVAGALTIAVNASMRGGRYSRDDLTRDVVATAVQMVTAGVGAAMNNAARGAQAAAAAAKVAGGAQAATAASAAFAQGLSVSQRLMLTASRHPIITQAALGAMSSGVTTALDPAMRRREDYGDKVLHSIFRGGIGGAVTAGVTHGITTGATGLAQRAAASRAMANALQRGASREAAIRLAARAYASAARSRAVEVGLRSIAGGTASMLGRGTEMGYENVFARGRHTSADFYREMRNAFIQNALQGAVEGAGDRFKRMRTTGGQADDRNARIMEADEARESAAKAFDREMMRFGRSPDGADTDSHPPVRPAANDNDVDGAEPMRRAVGDPEEGPARARSSDDEDLRLRSADGDDGDLRERPTRELPAYRQKNLDEHLASTEARPPPISVTEDLTPGRLRGGRSIPEHSDIRATDPKSESAALNNYHVLREADLHREVLLAKCVDPANPRYGEYVVFQGGESSVSRPPRGWIAERHSHPRLAGGEMAERLVRSLPSGSGGDFAVLRNEVDMMAGLVTTPPPHRRDSVIDVRLGETTLETHFSITRYDDGVYVYRVSFRPPHDGVDTIGPIYSLADYETAAGNLTGQRFGKGKRETYSMADGTTVSAGPPRAVHGEPTSAATRDDIDFVAGRMALAGDFEAQVRSGRQTGEFDPHIGRAATLLDAQARVMQMGLVGEPDSMIRLHNILNDDTIPVEVRAAISDATLAATRNHLIATRQLEPGEPLVMLFHGATPERTHSIVKHGIDMSRGPGGPNDDFGQGLYFTRSFETALRYRDTRSSAGGRQDVGGVVPYLLRGRELGDMVDVSTGGSLRAQWEAYAIRNAHVLLHGNDGLALTPMVRRILEGKVTSFSDFDASLHQNRGQLFNDFLASIGAHPDVIFGDLGGPLTHGIQLREVTDQVVVRGEDVAKVMNRQHVREGTADRDTMRSGGSLAMPGDSLRMRTEIDNSANVERVRRKVGDEIHENVEQGLTRYTGGETDTGMAGQASQILPEGHQMVNSVIADARRRLRGENHAMDAIMSAAPETTMRLMRQIASAGFEGRARHPDQTDVAAIAAELRGSGKSGAEAMAMALEFVTMVGAGTRLHQTLTEAPFSRRLVSSLGAAMGEPVAERASVRAARQFADRNSPTVARQELRRLLDADTDAIVAMITEPGSWLARARRYMQRRIAAGTPSTDAIADAVTAIRILSSDSFISTQKRWEASAAGISHHRLAELVRERPDMLLWLARTNPRQLSEWYADYILRQPRSTPPVIDADSFASYVKNRMISNILPIVSEASSIWANFKRMGLSLLKADAIQRGGANRPGLDIVGFSTPDGANLLAGDLVRVVIMDDKAHLSVELDSVSAMTGGRLHKNLLESASEIEAGLQALIRLGEHRDNAEIAAYVVGAEAAVRQMRAAAADLAALPPPPRGDMRSRTHFARVAKVLRRHNIVPVISSEYGNVRQLALWLRRMGFKLDDEYAKIFARELSR